MCVNVLNGSDSGPRHHVATDIHAFAVLTLASQKETVMQQIDEVVSGWLSGEEGLANPAGPLYIEGTAATEAALTDPGIGKVLISGATTCSYSGKICASICFCC